MSIQVKDATVEMTVTVTQDNDSLEDLTESDARDKASAYIEIVYPRLRWFYWGTNRKDYQTIEVFYRL